MYMGKEVSGSKGLLKKSFFNDLLERVVQAPCFDIVKT